MSTAAENSSSPVTEPPTKKMKVTPTEQSTNEMECVETPNRVKLHYYKLSENATAPVRGSKHAAGLDLCSAADVTIEAYGKALAMTDIQIALPDGCYGRVAPRSGLSWKHHIDVGAGVIDQDYRGNVGVVLFNHNKEAYNVKKGDRIAQLILERIYIPELIESQEKLPDTVRGAGGFGSTGMSAKVETNGKENGGNAEQNGKSHENGKSTEKGDGDKPKTETS